MCRAVSRRMIERVYLYILLLLFTLKTFSVLTKQARARVQY